VLEDIKSQESDPAAEKKMHDILKRLQQNPNLSIGDEQNLGIYNSFFVLSLFFSLPNFH